MLVYSTQKGMHLPTWVLQRGIVQRHCCLDLSDSTDQDCPPPVISLSHFVPCISQVRHHLVGTAFCPLAMDGVVRNVEEPAFREPYTPAVVITHSGVFQQSRLQIKTDPSNCWGNSDFSLATFTEISSSTRASILYPRHQSRTNTCAFLRFQHFRNDWHEYHHPLFCKDVMGSIIRLPFLLCAI